MKSQQGQQSLSHWVPPTSHAREREWGNTTCMYAFAQDTQEGE